MKVVVFGYCFLPQSLFSSYLQYTICYFDQNCQPQFSVKETDVLLYLPSTEHLDFQKPAVGSAQFGHQKHVLSPSTDTFYWLHLAAVLTIGLESK